jgi:hypothetical protein
MKSEQILLILDNLHPVLHLLHIIGIDMMQLLDLGLLDDVVGDGRELAPDGLGDQLLLLGDVFGEVA